MHSCMKSLNGRIFADERTEGAESVGGEQYFIRRVVGHHDLGPVDHRGHDEGEVVPAGAQRVTLSHNVQPGVEVGVEVVLQHRLDLCIADDGRLRVFRGDVADGRGVVRFHVGDDKVVEFPVSQLVGKVLEEAVADGLVNGVEQDGLLVFNKVGVIRHAVGHAVDALEEREAPVIRTYPDHIVRYTLGAIHYLYTSCFIFSDGYMISPSEIIVNRVSTLRPAAYR